MTEQTLKTLDRARAARQWHPVATSDDLRMRHVYHGQILGRELAVWRADDGHVNVWENRCLHRGVRLSIGINDGHELACQYHGWRYANRTAGCTYIPAHPADAPARTICNNTYPATERYGLVWTGEAPEGTAPDAPELQHAGNHLLVLRSLPVNAPLHLTAGHLADYTFYRSDHTRPATQVSTHLRRAGEFQVAVDWTDENGTSALVFFLQPTDNHRTSVHAVLATSKPPDNPLQRLKDHNFAMSLLRDRIEQAARQHPTPAAFTVASPRVSEALATLPKLAATGRKAPLRVVVKSIRDVATEIKAFELISVDTQLPTFQPGAHIDVHLANAQVRQYSLTNAPGQTDRYIIAVKREADGNGGSAFLHQSVRVGDTLAISLPRNNFPLRRDAVNTLLIAGGIGITPLLAMAQTLKSADHPFHLHYFVQDQSHAAFPQLLSTFGTHISMHTGLSPEQTRTTLANTLEGYKPASHVYLCGPAAMLSAARDLAYRMNWPDEAIHFEFFKNTTDVTTDQAFTVELARSGLTLTVESGQTLLHTLRTNGVELPSSCEQGACGTCRVGVLDGEPLHQDVYLSDAEHQRNDCLMTCVSRARSEKLVLDI